MADGALSVLQSASQLLFYGRLNPSISDRPGRSVRWINAFSSDSAVSGAHVERREGKIGDIINSFSIVNTINTFLSSM